MTTVVKAPPGLTGEMLEELRHGTYGRLWRGVDVIGYPGIAAMWGMYRRDGVTPAAQTVRGLHSEHPTFPRARFTVLYGGRQYVLFAREPVRRYGMQTGRLAPDGVTPIRLRPRPGKTRRR